MTDRPIVALAGTGGDLGGRIAKALVARGARLRALIRPDTHADERARLENLGASLAEADPHDMAAMASACDGVSCVVSALNGLWDVVVARQTVLIDAAVKAGVPRFVPSDYSEDFTQTRPGTNRNLDLRRDFMRVADAAAPLRVTSVLNGAFMDMLGREMPIIQPAIHRVLYWNSPDQPLDFTTMDDTAAYVAAAALDPETPRWLRIAGDSVSARDIAAIMSSVTGEAYKPLWAGNTASLNGMIALTRLLVPGSDEPFPPWQGMQYMRDQFSGRGKLNSTQNDRYPDLDWTSVSDLLVSRFGVPAGEGARSAVA